MVAAHDSGCLILVKGGNLDVLQRGLPHYAPEQQRLIVASLRSAGARQTRREPIWVNVNADIAEMAALMPSALGRSITISLRQDRDLIGCRRKGTRRRLICDGVGR